MLHSQDLLGVLFYAEVPFSGLVEEVIAGLEKVLGLN